MIAYGEALDRLLDSCTALPVERCPLAQAHGRVLAQDVAAPIDLPPFDASAMDGFGLAGDGAALLGGALLDIGGRMAAGDDPRRLAPGHCEIMTGAAIPQGIDRVVPVEAVAIVQRSVDSAPTRIRLAEDVPVADNIRRAGSDLAAGAVALKSGHRLDAAAIMLLSALGVAAVTVVRRPRVAIVCTGNELVPAAGQPLPPGAIYASNAPYCVAQLEAAGVEVVSVATVADTREAYVAAVRTAMALGIDGLVSTGGVSKGHYDCVPAAVDALGAETLFHNVAIRPGKPILAAWLPGRVLLLALPGNPIAVAAGLRFFLAPVYARWLARPAQPPVRARLEKALRRKAELRHFLKAVRHIDDTGQARVTVLDGQESYRIAPLAAANAWMVFDAPSGALAAGALVEVCPLPLLAET